MLVAVVLVGGAVLVVGAAVLRWRAGRLGGLGGGWYGYRDFARDPNRQATLRGMMARGDAEVGRLSKLEPAALVGMLVGDAADVSVKRAIEARGESCAGALLDALERPEFRPPYNETQRRAMRMFTDDSCPLEVVLGCLAKLGDAAGSNVGKVAKFTRDPNRHVRQEAASLLAGAASDECAGPLAASLADEDDYVRVRAMRGVRASVQAGRGSAAFRARMFDLVVPLLTRRDQSVSGEAPACLLALDRERAIREMSAPPAFATNNPQLQYVIRAMRTAGAPLPEAALLAAAEEAERAPETYPNAYVLEEAMLALAARPTPAVRALIDRSTRSPSADVREAAVRAMLAADGLTEPWRRPFAELERLGMEGLGAASAPVRLALRCRFFIDQVNNGGVSQWFVNGYGRWWRETAEAFGAVGAPRTRALVERAAAVFGPDGPPDRGYDAAVAKIHRRDEDPWDADDSEFYEKHEDVETLLLRYILANRVHFIEGPTTGAGPR